MSLQVWLPLNGDLKNNGISNLDITAVGISTYGNGKIGKNSFATEASHILFSWEYYTTEELSFSAWIKPNTPNSWQDVFSFGEGLNRIEVDNTLTKYRWYNTNGLPLITPGSLLFSIPNNEWHHIIMTADGNKVTFYLDGQQTAQFNQLNSISAVFGASQKCRIGCRTDDGAMHWNGFINDVRLYDNCLTKKEVQEIAKGLILHMPLDNNGMGGENILIDSMRDITSTAYNCATYVPETPLIAGETYTITACFTAPAGVTGYGIYLSGGYTGFGNLSISTAGTYTLTKTFTAKYYSGKTPTDNISYSYIRMYRFPNDGTVTASTTFHWAKVEKGNKTTAWSPNPTDNGNNPLHIYETSGYNYQGTAGQRMKILSDTSRYNVCTKWTDATDFIHIPNMFLNNQLIDEITIAGWFKTNTLNNTCPNMFNFGQNEFVRGRLANSTSLWSYWNINGTRQGITANSGKTLTDNTWHHYAFTFDKGIIKTYIDGILKNTTDHTATGTQLKVNSIYDWGLGGYNSTAEKFIGEQSDFRVYCTALSDLEVLELYEGRPAVDNIGNFYIHALEENELNPVGVKNTCVAMAPSDFYEDNIVNIAYNSTPYDYTGIVQSITPAKDVVNQTLWPGFKIYYGGKHMHNKRAKISMTVQWNGFSASSTAGTFNIYFQGPAILQDGSTSWTNPTGASNQVCSALNSAKNLKDLVLNKTPGTYNYETEFTIKCGTGDDFVAGHIVSMRADYSNGTGQIKFSNIKVTPMDTFSSEEQPFKISENNITSKYIYEY